MEPDGGIEAFAVAGVDGPFDHSLDCRVESLLRPVGESVRKLGQNVRQKTFQHLRHFVLREQPAVDGRVLPPREERPSFRQVGALPQVQ